MTTRERFELFCQKERELRDSRLLHCGWAPQFSLEYEAFKELRLEHAEPDREYLNSFLMLFRHFVLQGSPIHLNSIYNLAEREIASDFYRGRLRSSRVVWKKALKDQGIKLVVNGKECTPEHLMDLWINGYHFHMDETKRQELNLFVPLGVNINRTLFLALLVDGARQIFYVAGILRNAMADGLV